MMNGNDTIIPPGDDDFVGGYVVLVMISGDDEW